MSYFKKAIVASVLVFISNFTFAAKDISSSTVNYVYQLDSDATVFEFSASVSHSCGSNLYRVKSPNESVANRKFSLILTAFTTNGKVAFHDTQSCEGNRSVVAWVRLIK
ncbi:MULTISPECIES: hypothetical protein [unclassified Colwellia]|uniref:hypothetical protein n=1 Tax=unclassified Colwellia TaxID=196834 RepID=UPI0015F691DB|nr:MULTISPECIES: hypothetical protein [unclassified Colwellia]MBA6258241.1 hypothetical protein [Colwellia sp. MB3u-28]MBA6258507.1 hypothetical protein [Colwellia sp. MB3u-41]